MFGEFYHIRACINTRHITGAPLCDPIKWWVSHRPQFPNVYMLACDVLSIPGEFFFLLVLFCNLNCLVMLGSAVAVERIFSGGRDTISLR